MRRKRINEGDGSRFYAPDSGTNRGHFAVYKGRIMRDIEDLLSMWVIYFDPSDYPEKWVVRRWDVGPGVVRARPKADICDSLEAARAFVPPGLSRIPADERDE